MSPRVSVLVVNWNTRDLVVRCLDSISAGVGGDAEVVVVDNGSADDSVETLRQRTDVRLVENPANVGYAEAVNQAYRLSSGELVMLLNSDVEVLPGAGQTLVRFLDERPEVAGVAPLYLNPDGTAQAFHFRLPTFAMTLANGSALVRRLPTMARRLRRYRMLDEDFSVPRRVDQPSASCLLLRRSVLHSDRVFDERYPIFFNDVQLARELARAGRELWVVPSAKVVHEAHASTRLLRGSLRRQYVGSIVQMLKDTEPRRRVLLYQMLVLLQSLGLLLLRRPDAMSLRDVAGALRGDPGPLPSLAAADRP